MSWMEIKIGLNFKRRNPPVYTIVHVDHGIASWDSDYCCLPVTRLEWRSKTDNGKRKKKSKGVTDGTRQKRPRKDVNYEEEQQLTSYLCENVSQQIDVDQLLKTLKQSITENITQMDLKKLLAIVHSQINKDTTPEYDIVPEKRAEINHSISASQNHNTSGDTISRASNNFPQNTSPSILPPCTNPYFGEWDLQNYNTPNNVQSPDPSLEELFSCTNFDESFYYKK